MHNHGKQNIKGVNKDEHLGLRDGTIDIKRILELLEEYTPGAIWNLETRIECLEESVGILKELNYII